MYYKGVLAKTKEFIIEPNRVLGTRNRKNEFKLNFDIQDKSQIETLNTYLIKSVSKYNVTRTDIVNIFNKLVETKAVPVEDKYEEVIFEVYKDEYGSLYGKELHSGLFFPLNSQDSVLADYSVITEEEADIEKYVLSVKLTFAPKNMSKASIVIDSFKEASEDDVKSYLKKYKKSFFNSRKHKSFIEFLELLSKNNQFTTHGMEKFTKIDTIEKDAEVKEIKNEKINEPQALKEPENNIDFLEYVDNLRYTVISDFINENDTLSIFLRFLDAYSSYEQEKIFNDLAYIYLILIFKYKEEITLDNLKDSYFKDMLNIIISNLEALKENGIIDNKNEIILDKEITPEYVINLIKQSEFNKEKLKEQEFGLNK